MAKRAILGQLKDVDIRLLRVFRVVTEAGGISAAELELNIGRSTISTHIKDLEIRLGCHPMSARSEWFFAHRRRTTYLSGNHSFTQFTG